jgi:hypothetical protein
MVDLVIAGVLQTLVCAYVYLRARAWLHGLGIGLMDRFYGWNRRF